MEPPPDGGGNPALPIGVSLRNLPSMEPPPDGGGNFIGLGRRALLRFAFNGAAAGWRRKRKRQGARPRAGVPFNGAAAGWRRKRSEKCTREDSPEGPSMEPPPDGGGNHRGGRQQGRRRRPFNGAAAGWRRKPRSSAFQLLTAYTLQWSRRRMAAETRGVSARRQA